MKILKELELEKLIKILEKEGLDKKNLNLQLKILKILMIQLIFILKKILIENSFFFK